MIKKISEVQLKKTRKDTKGQQDKGVNCCIGGLLINLCPGLDQADLDPGLGQRLKLSS